MEKNSFAGRVMFPAEVSRLRRAWTYTTGDAIESSPVVVGAVVYIGSRDHHMYALAARTGKQFWSYTTGGALYSTPAFVDGAVYVASLDHTLSALDAGTGSLLRSFATVQAIEC